MGSTPKGLTVQNGDTVFVATIKDFQILQKGKKLVQEKTKFTPSAIAANPAISGEFAVGAEVNFHKGHADRRTLKSISIPTPARQSLLRRL